MRFTTILSAAALTVAGLFAATPASAQVVQEVSFQGRLTNSGGTPITASTSVTFALYTASTGGTAIWSETQSVTPNANGIYAVRLGSATAFPGTVTWNATYYLGITVAGDAEMTPRYQLTSSPFALRTSRIGLLTDTGLAAATGVTDANLDTLTNGSNADSLHTHAFSAITGSVADAQLSANVALLNSTQTFSGNKTFSGSATFTGAVALPATGITGAGAGSGLDADLLDGQSGAFYLDYNNFTNTPVANNHSHFGQTWAGNNSGYGLMVDNSSSAAGADGIIGEANSATGAGVIGNNTATSGVAVGVLGTTASSSGYGVQGTTVGGRGVYGQGTGAGWGVYGTSATGTGIRGETSSAVLYGVQGYNNSTTINSVGVHGSGAAGGRWGVMGDTSSGRGVYGVAGANTGYGVYGLNTAAGNTATGLIGESSNTTTGGRGVYGIAQGPGGDGVWAWSNDTTSNGSGLYAVANSPNGYGVWAVNSATTGNPVTIYATGSASGRYAVRGDTVTGRGIYGLASNNAGRGGYFENTAGGIALEARGDVRFGPTGQYQPGAFEERLRILRGRILSNGAISYGTGFSCTRTSAGNYSITYSNSFVGQSATPLATAVSAGYTCSISIISTGGCTIRTYNASGTQADSSFDFIVLGLR